MSAQELDLASDLNLEDSEWMNAREAARYLRIFRKDGEPCTARVRNLVNQGRIPFYKPYGRLLFKRSELRQLVANSKKGVFNACK
jgi:hypothetical protein